MPHPSLSIIIPVLNEAESLPALLDDLESQEGLVLETIIGDGGSTDGSQVISEARGARWVAAPRGRGAQMNAAAAMATGEYLLFLHADSRVDNPHLLGEALSALKQQIAKSGHDRVAGHFPLHFLHTSRRHTLAYRYLEEKTAFNRPNTTNGDQGFLMAQTFFQALGGFDKSQPFLEDQKLAEKIRTRGIWITLPGVLGTSARRFETEGFHRRYILMSIIMGLHSTGVQAFFDRAPEAYRTQTETSKLLLTPFFRIIREMMRKDLGLRGSLRAWFDVGRYVRQNSWQLFYACDVTARPLLGKGRYPFLAFHDRVVGPLTDFRIFDGITAVLCFLWVMGILAPFFSLIEWRERLYNETTLRDRKEQPTKEEAGIHNDPSEEKKDRPAP